MTTKRTSNGKTISHKTSLVGHDLAACIEGVLAGDVVLEQVDHIESPLAGQDFGQISTALIGDEIVLWGQYGRNAMRGERGRQLAYYFYISNRLSLPDSSQPITQGPWSAGCDRDKRFALIAE